MKPKVYFTKEITSENLIKIYQVLDIELPGKVGIKVSTGEDGSKGYLKADLIGPLVKSLNGTIIESPPTLALAIVQKTILKLPKNTVLQNLPQ